MAVITSNYETKLKYNRDWKNYCFGLRRYTLPPTPCNRFGAC